MRIVCGGGWGEFVRDVGCRHGAGEGLGVEGDVMEGDGDGPVVGWEVRMKGFELRFRG